LSGVYGRASGQLPSRRRLKGPSDSRCGRASVAGRRPL